MVCSIWATLELLKLPPGPYGPKSLAIKAMTKAITKGAYYVNETAQLLKQMIAERHN